MPRYHIWTIGCQMNKADSAYISDCLERMGLLPAARADEADIIVLNSCVVRQSAESRVVNKLNSLSSAKGDRMLVLTGCMVDSDSDCVRKRFPQVDLAFAPQDFPILFRFLKEQGLSEEGWESNTCAVRYRPVAFVNIIKGCDNFCSYCIVPYRRGTERSRPVADIVHEVEGLVAGGTKEVTLLGQNVNSYGHDLPDRPVLSDLLTELDRIGGLARIRFLTSHPKDMSQQLIDAMADLGKVCEHLSLPVQAGDDDILRAMGRGYTSEQYIGLVERIRRAVPGVALSTDVIVGFPGENEERFERTYDLLSRLRFDTVHVACYSPRQGTVAAREMKDSVSAGDKIRRRKLVEELQESIAAEINDRLRGKRVEVLVEGRKKGKWWGRTRADKLVFFSDAADRTGQLVDIEVTRTGPWSLQGNLVD